MVFFPGKPPPKNRFHWYFFSESMKRMNISMFMVKALKSSVCFGKKRLGNMDNTLRQDMQSSFLPTQLYSYNTCFMSFFSEPRRNIHLCRSHSQQLHLGFGFDPFCLQQQQQMGGKIPRVMSCCKAGFHRHCWWFLLSTLGFGNHFTPWKVNMEHTNHPFRKENDLPNLYDYVPC